MMTKDQMVGGDPLASGRCHHPDAIERLEVIELIERGIEAANAGRVITQDEVERRVAQWRE